MLYNWHEILELDEHIKAGNAGIINTFYDYILSSHVNVNFFRSFGNWSIGIEK